MGGGFGGYGGGPYGGFGGRPYGGGAAFAGPGIGAGGFGLVDTVADVSVLMATSAHGIRGMLDTVTANGRGVRYAVGGAIRRESVRGY